MEPINDRVIAIRTALQILTPIDLNIEDESYLHAGHAGASSGGHFVIHIVSDAFIGKTAVKRHQMVYEALGELMQTDIHAITIHVKAPAE